MVVWVYKVSAGTKCYAFINIINCLYVHLATETPPKFNVNFEKTWGTVCNSKQSRDSNC